MTKKVIFSPQKVEFFDQFHQKMISWYLIRHIIFKLYEISILLPFKRYITDIMLQNILKSRNAIVSKTWFLILNIIFLTTAYTYETLYKAYLLLDVGPTASDD